MDRHCTLPGCLGPFDLRTFMSATRLRTILARSEATIRERASKFIGIALPLSSEEELKSHVRNIAKEHHTARHVCYALVLGNKSEVQRSNDDGEPSGTAGPPILRAITGAGLTNTTVLVVRYFGGTLLGKGGLVQAYGDAARAALAQATIVEHAIMGRIRFTCSLQAFEAIKREVTSNGGSILDKDFSSICQATAALPLEHLERIEARWHSMGLTTERIN